MNSKEVLEILNENDIFDILTDLNADPIMTFSAIECRTICHHGEGNGSHKLYYYFNNKVWKCYTHGCSIGNIFNLISMVRGWEFIESFRYVCDKFNLIGDGDFEETLDLKIFDKFNKAKEKYEYKFIDKRNLNVYYPIYHETWLEDNITIDAMKKYNIMFNVKQNRIIIPHFDIDGNLIGIRRRNLLDEEVAKGKYMPEIYNKNVYNHSLGNNIYGINCQIKDDLPSKTIILFEAEKSVLQLEGYHLGLMGGALCGSSLTDGQFKILVDLIDRLDIEEVIISLDKEYLEDGDELSEFYKRKIRENMINKLLPYVDVSVIWDTEGVLDYKDSPTDKGKKVFEELLNKRIMINE